jgi:hypothetical protein
LSKSKSGTVAFNITVPAELRKEMDGVEGANWSQVATEAFRAKVLEFRSQTGGETMDDVLKRMKAAAERDANADRAAGKVAGRDWVVRQVGHASPKQLRRLDEASDRECLFDGEPDAFGWVGSLYRAITDDGQFDRSTLDEFWEAVLRYEPKRIYDQDFAEGFVEGALDAWHPIERQM